MIVNTLKFHPDARIPEKAYEGDFCYDVYAVSEEELAPGVYKYGIGLGFQIKRGDEIISAGRRCDVMNAWHDTSIRFDFSASPLNFSIDFRPRSSVWKTGMVLSNCIGTVDEGYINDISAIFYHVLPSMPRYKVGDKIGQIKIGVTFPIEFREVKEFKPTERGLRGYGSSGQ